MSFKAVAWALAQPVSKSSTKFVLVAMASVIDSKAAEMDCFASVAKLAELTAQDRKTVLDNLQRLRDTGYLLDTGKRAGTTGQIPVYRLKTPENGTVAPTGNDTENGTGNEPENGTSPENGTVPFFPTNSPVFPAKQSRFSLPTVPKTGHGIGNEQGLNKEGIEKKDKRAVALVVPGVPESLLADYLKVRAAKKAGPLTATVLAGLTREATKAGITLAQAITVCCERGWQGFKADWYRPALTAAPAPESNYERGMRERYERMGLSVAAPAPGQEQAADFFDMEVTDVTPRRLG